MGKKTIGSVVSAALLTAGFGISPVAADENSIISDTRMPIMLRPSERVRMLADMRRYLKGMRDLFEALARDDMAGVAETARGMGSIHLYDVRLSFPTSGAVEFRERAFEIHRVFDRIAADAETQKNARQVQAQLAATMGKCIECHARFQLTDSPHSSSGGQ